MDEKILGLHGGHATCAAAGAARSVLAGSKPAETMQVERSSPIRPFRVEFPEADLDDLRRRILVTRFSERETVADFSQGTPLAALQDLTRYWASDYDWRRAELELNRYPNFITEIDGLDIHFIHARSRHPKALPVIVCHGWPYSVAAMLKIIQPLTNPTAHGGTAAEAFDVVIPSMPGYGFSGKPNAAGWDPPRIARAYITLMKRLGYTRFVAQGGDWGGLIVDLMALEGAGELIGIHTNMAGAVPQDLDAAAQIGAPAPGGLSAEERNAYEQLDFVYKNIAYAKLMGSRPQTLAALSDSPAALAAFIIDPIQSVLRGRHAAPLELATGSVLEGLSRDDVLDNITLYWLTNTGVSASRLYWENKIPYFSPKGVTIPVAISVFPEEVYTPPRSWAERAYSNLIHYNRVDRGGHFPAWEQSMLFTSELRTGFRSLRRSG
jgi:pimeloyl-ACP methyl ester carboxylesterase